MFDLFWSTYPRKLARRDAERAWSKIHSSKHLDVLAALHKHIQMWKQKAVDKQFIPYPATWLNGARWEDEIELAPEMPQCDWNKNGNREPGGRCAAQSVRQNECGNYYCAVHCQRIGLRVVRG
jgi:hypothetical protein